MQCVGEAAQRLLVAARRLPREIQHGAVRACSGIDIDMDKCKWHSVERITTTSVVNSQYSTPVLVLLYEYEYTAGNTEYAYL